MKLIDLDSLIAEFNKRCRGECCCCEEDYCGSGNDGCGCKVIDEAPTVDAVAVVRCKDCKHYYADPWGWGNCVFEGGVSRRTKTNDFCSWGERREDEID